MAKELRLDNENQYNLIGLSMVIAFDDCIGESGRLLANNYNSRKGN